MGGVMVVVGIGEQVERGSSRRVRKRNRWSCSPCWMMLNMCRCVT